MGREYRKEIWCAESNPYGATHLGSRMFISLDMSTSSTGWCVWENNKIKEYGCIVADKALPLNKRIHIMWNGIAQVLEKYEEIDKVVAEDPLPRTDHTTNEATYRALNWLQGYVGVMIKDSGIKDIVFVQPNSWRSQIGIKTGRGKKREELKAADIAWVKNQFGVEVNDDIADAIGIGFSSIDSAF